MNSVSKISNENESEIRETPSTVSSDASDLTGGHTCSSDNSLQGHFPKDDAFLCPLSTSSENENTTESVEMKQLVGVDSVSKPSTSEPTDRLETPPEVPKSSSSTSNSSNSSGSSNGSDSSKTSNESVCRICQLAVKETGENLKQSECSCRGTLAKIHISCLHEWVRYRGTNRCEICQDLFEGVTPPESPGIMDREASRLLAIAAISWQLDRSRPFTRKKRAAMAAVIVFLVIVTCVTSLLTVSADREYQRISTSPFSSKDDVDESNVVFSICIAFTFFCATMTIGLVLIWLGMECCFQMQRRAIMRTASARLLRNINTI